nr:inositol transporter 4-like [Ipomoea batatas]
MSPATMKNDGASEQGWCLRYFFPISLYQEWSLRTQGWSTPPELSSHFAPPPNKLSTTPLPEKKRDQAASHAMVKLTLLACLVDQNKAEEVRAILEKIYPAINEVEEEMNGLKSSLEEEKCEESVIWYGLISKVKNAWRNTVVRRGLYVGIIVQVAQNLVGIRMYYIPTILQLVGFASNTTTLALSLVTSDLNVVGTIISRPPRNPEPELGGHDAADWAAVAVCCGEWAGICGVGEGIGDLPLDPEGGCESVLLLEEKHQWSEADPCSEPRSTFPSPVA